MKEKKHKIVNNKNKNIVFYYIIISIIGFVLYGQSIQNTFNIDDDYVYENHVLVEQGIRGIPEIFKSRYNTKDEQYFGYRPLTIAIYAIEYEIFGSNPHTAHFFNIIYYIISCLLLFYFLQKLLKRKFPNLSLWISFLIVLIFQTHAIHTEVVLSLKNREEIMSLIFGLISSIYALKFYDTKKIWTIIIAVMSLSLAFLAKESAIVFIALIPLSIIFFKTDIKILQIIKIKKHDKKLDANAKLKRVLLILILLFIVITDNFNIINNTKINIHNWESPINEYFVWFAFILVYTYILIRNRKTENKITVSKRNVFLWTLSLIMLILSPLFNSHLSSLLVLVLLFLSLNSKDKSSEISFKFFENLNRKIVISVLVIVFLGGLVLAATYFIPKQSLPETNAPVYKWQNPAFTTNSVGNKAAIAIYSLGYYAKLLLIPYPLRFYYGYKMIPDVTMTNINVLLSLLFNLLLLFIAFRGFNKRHLFSYGILFYFIAIFPFANTFFPFTGIIAERILFVPSIGFSIVAVAILLKLLKIKHDQTYTKSVRNKTIALALIIILPNSLITLKRAPNWKDRATLFEHDIQHLENSAKANTIYANLLIGEVYNAIKQNAPINHYRSQINLAVKHFNQAAHIDTTYSNPWHNLGYINMILYKNYELAAKQFSKSIAADSSIAASYLNRGIANYYLGEYDKSIKDLRSYVINNQNFKDKELDKAYFFTAKSRLETSDTVEATKNYLLALENLKVHNLNKTVLDDIKKHFIMVKRFDLAIKVSDFEISINPQIDAPYVDKGNYYLLSGDTVQAIKNWEIAFEKFNGNYNIGMTLYQYFSVNGNTEKANYYYSKAVEYRQSHPKK
ncbi:MAG: hypothetical protein PHW82_04155 [Bacteroidales bacterium]|nr:hypothetical protein [Bacteroidales bacterium]